MTRLRYIDLATGAAGSTVDATLSGSHNDSTTTLTLNAALTYANGSAVPTITGSDYFMLSILDANGHVAEVVKVTAYTAGATSATAVRAQEGTAGVSHASGAKLRNDGTPTDFTPWSLLVDLPLTTLTGWTGSGTGASWGLTGSGSVIRDAGSPGNNVHRLSLDQTVPLADVLAQCEIMFNSTNNTTSSRGGISFGGVAEVPLVSLLAGVSGFASAVDFEMDSLESQGNQALAANIAHGTWITLRVRKVGRSVTAWVNGTLISSVDMESIQANNSSGPKVRNIGLYTYAADVSFRNLKLWVPTDPVA